MPWQTETKNWAKRLAAHSGTLAALARLTDPRSVILMYHSVQHDPEQYAHSIGAGHTTVVFERQMELVATRYNPVTLEDIRAFLKEGKRLPPRAVAVTFDDGFADNFHFAAPILSRFGIQAAFYLTVSLIGTDRAPWYCRLRYAFQSTRMTAWQNLKDGQVRKLSTSADRNGALLQAFETCASMAGVGLEAAVSSIEQELEVESLAPHQPLMMNWEQARKLRDAGHVVGSHTLTHPNVAYLDAEQARTELTESKAKLEQELVGSVVHFSYPHPALDPHWNERTVALTAAAGYLTAVTTSGGPVRRGDNPLALQRIRTPRPEHDFLWNLDCAFLGRRV